MDYNIFELESPVNKESFDEFTKEDVVKYFKWYIDHIDERIEYLQNHIKVEDPIIRLDYTVGSLVSVWKWYEKKIEVEHYTLRELRKEAKKYPDWLREEIMSDDTKISAKTLAICSDLAMYFAEVIRRNISDIVYWGYYTKPKNRMSVNEPVLLGFMNGMELNPRRVMFHCTLCSIEKPDENMLVDLYHTWISYIKQ